MAIICADFLLNVIPRSSAEYIAAKAAFRKSCGYNESSIKANFSLAPGLTEETLVDFLIGKVPSLPVSEMIVKKSRFEIALDNDADHIRDATLTVDLKPLQKGKLIVFSTKGKSRVEMSVDVFGARHTRSAKTSQEAAIR